MTILVSAGFVTWSCSPAFAQSAGAQNQRADDAYRSDDDYGDEENEDLEDAAVQAQQVQGADGVARAGEQVQIDDGDLAQELTAQLQAETEPYEPLGIRMGSFLFFPELQVDRRYEDNVFNSSTVRAKDWSTWLTPTFELRSNWSRHALSGEFEYQKILQDEFTSENRKNLAATLNSRLDITRHTNVEGEAAYGERAQGRGSVDVPATVTQRPVQRTKNANIELNHTFSRLTAQLRGAVSQEDFEDVSLVGGGTFDNATRDNTENELVGRLSYEFKPGVVIFAEGSGNEIDFVRANSNGNFSDSTGWAALGGFSLDLGSIITGEISAGYAAQTPGNRALKGIEGPVFAANLIWAVTPLTSLRFNADFSIETTVLTDSIGSLVQSVGVEVEHEFRRNIILTAGLTYETADFAASNLEDEELTYELEGEYLLNRSVGLVAGYEYTDFSVTNGTRDYNENIFRLGLNLRR